MNRKLVTIGLAILIIAIVFLFSIRFIIGGDEDTWICQNGIYVKHGNPKTPPPLTGCSPTISPSSEKIIGGDKDEHGCLIAAGYSWCESKNKCLRPWEEPCNE